MQELEAQGLAHVLDFRPAPIQRELGEVDIEEAIKNTNSLTLDILRMADKGYGTYLEIAYEWTYQEAIEVLEIMDIVDEKQETERRTQAIQAKYSK